MMTISEGMRMRALAASILVALLGQSGLAQAASNWKWEQPPRVVEDRFRIELSMLSAGFDTDARVDGGTEFPGTEFNAEDDFGLAGSKYMLLPEVTLFPGKRHLVRLNGLSVTRNGHKAVERVIEYDAETFEEGDFIDSTFDIKSVGLTYGYRFARYERFEAAGLLGVQVLDFTTNAEIRGQTMREPTGEVAPIPVIGLEARVGLTQKLSIEARGHYTSVTFEGISGSITDIRLAATWRLNPHLVGGLGYSTLNISAESENEDSAGMAEFHMSGPMLFVRASL